MYLVKLDAAHNLLRTIEGARVPRDEISPIGEIVNVSGSV
jgi:hypothetical protein